MKLRANRFILREKASVILMRWTGGRMSATAPTDLLPATALLPNLHPYRHKIPPLALPSCYPRIAKPRSACFGGRNFIEKLRRSFIKNTMSLLETKFSINFVAGDYIDEGV
jgi:hypothetical protein